MTNSLISRRLSFLSNLSLSNGSLLLRRKWGHMRAVAWPWSYCSDTCFPIFFFFFNSRRPYFYPVLWVFLQQWAKQRGDNR